MKTIKMGVMAVNANGEPDMFLLSIRVDDNYDIQNSDGEHYERAIEIAKEEGYEGWNTNDGMIPFDENDNLFKYLKINDDYFNWDDAIYDLFPSN